MFKLTAAGFSAIAMITCVYLGAFPRSVLDGICAIFVFFAGFLFWQRKLVKAHYNFGAVVEVRKQVAMATC